ncbi:hypothetical protein D3C85_1856500 [compost metagenome]
MQTNIFLLLNKPGALVPATASAKKPGIPPNPIPNIASPPAFINPLLEVMIIFLRVIYVEIQESL